MSKGPRQHEVRLIGGQFKRSKLPVLDRPGLRPTPDRVRETLFNWLGQDLTGWRCLDAFAGSGALGFEAASRGASVSVLLEADGAAVVSLTASALRLGAAAVRIERADALKWMAGAAPASFDLVFLDPPFDSELGTAAVVRAQRLLTSAGLIYLEGASFMTALPVGLVERRRLKAGAVCAQLLALN